MTVFFYTVVTILCLGAHELYEDTRKQDVCLGAFVFFSAFVVLGLQPPDISDSNAMFFNGAVTLLFFAFLSWRGAHWTLKTVCSIGMCAHTFGYLIAIDAIPVDLAVYNQVILNLNILFVILLLALSDVGIRKLSMGLYKVRSALIRLGVNA